MIVAAILLGSHQQVHATWVQSGPEGGASSIAVDPTNPAIIYAASNTYSGSNGNGIYKSTDGGATWQLKSTGLSSLLVNTLAIDPVTSSTLYAGTAYSGGIFKSSDSGNTWSPVNNGINPPYMTNMLVIDPTNSAVIYAGGRMGGALLKSTNGGASWTSLPLGSVYALAVDPSSPQTLYAYSGSDGSCSALNGIYKSTNGGASWSVLINGISNHLLSGEFYGCGDIYAFAIDPNNPSTIYAALDSAGVIKSTDSGANWTIPGNRLPYGARAMAMNPANPSVLYVGMGGGGGTGVYKSTDAGSTWTGVSTGLADTNVGGLAITPAVPETLFVGTDSSLSKSTDGAISWNRSNKGIFNSNISSLAVNPVNPAEIIASAYYLGFFKSTDTARNWNLISPAKNLLATAYAPTDPPTMYAFGTSRDGGLTWQYASNGVGFYVHTYAVAPTDPSIVYAGADDGVYRTADSGTTWTSVSTGLPGLPMDISVNSLAVSPANAAIVYAVANGALYKTTTSGSSWFPLSGLPGATTVAIDPRNAATVYVAYYQGVYKSVDDGANWVKVSTGLPASGIKRVTIDPTNSLKLYAGTEKGVYRSIDGTQTWAPFNLASMAANVSAFAINPTGTTLFSGSVSNGVFTLALKTSASSSQSNLEFGDVYLGSTPASQSITLTNNGQENLIIDTAMINGAESSQFDIQGNTCANVSHLLPGATCTITVGINPTSAGIKSASLDISYNAANGAPLSVTLNGAVYTVPVITTTSLPDGTIGIPYSAILNATGGKTPYTWSVFSGTLPAGLSLNPATGAIAGTPSAAGSNTITCKVADLNGKPDTKTLSLNIKSPAVTKLDAWTNLYSASPNNTAATNLPVGSITVGNGTNRLLLVAIVMEIGTAANPIISASYGGTALTQIKVTNNTQREIVWMGSLKESQLKSGSQPLTITYNNAVGKASALHVKWASFSGVNQTNPFVSSIAKNTNTASAIFGTTVSYVTNGMTTLVAGNGGTPVTGTLAVTPAFTAGTVSTTNTQTSNSFTTNNHAANGTYSSATSVVWSGANITKWSGLVAVSLRP